MNRNIECAFWNGKCILTHEQTCHPLDANSRHCQAKSEEIRYKPLLTPETPPTAPKDQERNNNL